MRIKLSAKLFAEQLGAERRSLLGTSIKLASVPRRDISADVSGRDTETASALMDGGQGSGPPLSSNMAPSGQNGVIQLQQQPPHPLSGGGGVPCVLPWRGRHFVTDTPSHG